MFRGTSKLFFCVCALAIIVALAGNASGDIIAQYAGPGDFNGSSSYVTLPNVSIGLEGRLDLEFKANQTSSPATLWSLSEGNYNDYRLGLDSNNLKAFIETSSQSAYAVNASKPFTDTTSWHSASLAWKDGQDTLFTLDGTTTHLTNAYSLSAWTSSFDTLGVVKAFNVFWYNGSLRNVFVRDTYAAPAPEPSTLVLLSVGVLSLLAYAWRKRK